MGLPLRLCRFCMIDSDLMDIFNVDNEIGLDFKAMECNLVNIRQNDGLPLLICKSCTFKLNQCYEFKLQCIDTELNLKKLIDIKKDDSHQNIENDNNNTNLLEEIKCEPDFFSDSDDGLITNNITKMVAKIKKKHSKKESKKHKGDKINKKKKQTYINENYLCKSTANRVDSILKDSTKSEDIPKLSSEKDDKCNIPIDLRVLNLSKLESIQSVPLKPFQCEQCGVTFKLKSILKKHILTHTNEKSYACPLCPKRYTREEHRVVHMRSHAGVKPYVCEICARSFSKGQDLIRHKRIHSDEKNFSCMRCDKKFKRSSDVRAHMRTHTGARPYSCKNCYKSYASPSGLRKHQNTCDKNKKIYTEFNCVKNEYIEGKVDCMKLSDIII